MTRHRDGRRILASMAALASLVVALAAPSSAQTTSQSKPTTAPAASPPATSTPAPAPVPPVSPAPAAPAAPAASAPLPGNITSPPPAAATTATQPAAKATPLDTSVSPLPSLAQQKKKVKDTELTGLGFDDGSSRRKGRHKREPWPRVSYRQSYYNPYCGPPPAYGVYVVRVR